MIGFWEMLLTFTRTESYIRSVQLYTGSADSNMLVSRVYIAIGATNITDYLASQITE